MESTPDLLSYCSCFYLIALALTLLCLGMMREWATPGYKSSGQSIVHLLYFFFFKHIHSLCGGAEAKLSHWPNIYVSDLCAGVVQIK